MLDRWRQRLARRTSAAASHLRRSRDDDPSRGEQRTAVSDAIDRIGEQLETISKQLDVARTIPSTPLRLREQAVTDGIEHIRAHHQFDEMRLHLHNLDALRTALDEVELDGEVAEFGVYQGQSLTVIAKHFPDLTVHGFDSFVGLPESWSGSAKGAGDFGVGGRPPDLPVDNVEFHVGWFEDSVPVYAERHHGPFAFVHLDADLYSSTRTVLEALGSWCVPGTVLVFDEYFGYYGWQRHEHRAFMELLEARGLEYRAIAVGHMNLAVKLTAR